MKGLFVGLAGLDFVYYLDQAPEENKKYKTNDYSCTVGGPAANAAITYSLLGGDACLVSCIGNSPYGKVILDTLTHEYGIQVIDLAVSSSHLPSISSILINTANGNRTVWSGQQPNWSPTGRQETTGLLKTAGLLESSGLLETAAFCLSDCQLYGISSPLLALAKERGISIVLDAGSWKDYIGEYFALADTIISSGDFRSPEGRTILVPSDQYPGKDLAVTRGEEAILWKNASGSGAVVPPSVKAVDTLGAGDVFHGAFCYFRFLCGSSFVQALQQAAEVAASSVSYRGVAEGIRTYRVRMEEA